MQRGLVPYILVLHLIYPYTAKHFTASIAGYTRAIELNPNNAIYWANRAAANIKLENYG